MTSESSLPPSPISGTASPPQPADEADALEPWITSVDDSAATERARLAQDLLDAVRSDAAHLRSVRAWLAGALEREARLTAYLGGDWLEDRDLLITAAVPESDFDVFGEDTALEEIARAQAARRALHHALDERG